MVSSASQRLVNSGVGRPRRRRLGERADEEGCEWSAAGTASDGSRLRMQGIVPLGCQFPYLSIVPFVSKLENSKEMDREWTRMEDNVRMTRSEVRGRESGVRSQECRLRRASSSP